MVWETHPAYTVLTVLLRLLRSVVPVATLWIGKLIIDTVIAASRGRAALDDVWWLVVLEIGIVVVNDLLTRISAFVESQLGDLFGNRTSIRLMEHAATLDLQQFEDPAFYDKMERARQQTTSRIGLLGQIVGSVQDTITLVTLAAAVASFNPWLTVLLVVAVVPAFLGDLRFSSLQYSLMRSWTPERRRLDYMRMIGASDTTAKEVQMFGLSAWLVERYRTLSGRFIQENRRLALRRSAAAFGLALIGTAAYYGAYAIAISDAVAGAITVGTLTFLAGSFDRCNNLSGRILSAIGGVLDQALYLADLFDFFSTRPTITSPANPLPLPETLKVGFRFENVGFRYPGSERWAIRNVSFTLGPGERIAFVGENGAGKTTITKLIARLYDPTEGRILLEGNDLRSYSLVELRRAIAVIFQDFVRYDLKLDENIGVGKIESVERWLDEQDAAESSPKQTAAAGEATHPAIDTAARQSMAATLLGRLTGGYRQMLGRRFDEGVNLSGGEWQKVALARAYMRNAQVLILDEPTAALDARAEYEVFVRFSELVAGRMAIIISHRFSTVRMADRIIVLRGGTVEQQGTHEELLAAGGLYAELFRMQAEGYR